MDGWGACIDVMGLRLTYSSTPTPTNPTPDIESCESKRPHTEKRTKGQTKGQREKWRNAPLEVP